MTMSKNLLLLIVILTAVGNAWAADKNQQTMLAEDFEYVGALYFMSPNILECATANIGTQFPTKKVLIAAMAKAEFEACLADVAEHNKSAPTVDDVISRQLRIAAGKHAAMLAAQ